MRELTLNRLPKRVLGKLDLETVFKASRCIIAAQMLLVFRKLDEKELSGAELGRRTGIHRKYCSPFLDFLVYLGLMKKKDNLYSNSALAKRYFLKMQSIDWTRFWSEYCAKDYEALSVMEEALQSGKNWRHFLGKERKSDYELLQKDPKWARDFTYALYDENKPSSEILAKNLNLSEYQSILDIGGGSGVMSIALVRAYPQLKACILDFEFVCEAAKRIIRREGMSRRIKTLVGDMNKAIPNGFDVMMFWDIGYIDADVLKMAYNSLPDGGLVVRNCAPPSKSMVPSPSSFISEYLSVLPKSQTRKSIVNSLMEVGFRSVKCRLISQSLVLITGRKE